MMIIIFLFFLAGPVLAANPYQMGKVEYFDHKPLVKALETDEERIDWREPIVGVDGRMTYYVPPKPLLDLLDDPSPDKASAYLKWQRVKAERMVKAQMAVLDLQASEAEGLP